MKITLIIMLLYLNMTSQIQLGNVQLNNVTSFEITESIDEISNTAKITIPRMFQQLDGKPILEQIKEGDKVVINAGYYRDNDLDIKTEFVGYIREIKSSRPLEIYCDDEMYLLQQTNYVKSYKETTLLQVLKEIIPSTIRIECPDVNLGKLQIDNASAFVVLQNLKDNHGLYSKMFNGVLKVGLRDLLDANIPGVVHEYTLNPTNTNGNFIKQNNLTFKRKEDFQLKVRVTATNPNTKDKKKKIQVEVGSKMPNASLISLTYPGRVSESELKAYAESIYNKRCYDGYTGSITGFGVPRVHAGDAVQLINADDEPGNYKYLVEKTVISYNESGGFSRKNDLSYKIG